MTIDEDLLNGLKDTFGPVLSDPDAPWDGTLEEWYEYYAGKLGIDLYEGEDLEESLRWIRQKFGAAKAQAHRAFVKMVRRDPAGHRAKMRYDRQYHRRHKWHDRLMRRTARHGYRRRHEGEGLGERDPGQSFMDVPFELRVTSGGALHCPGCGHNGPSVRKGEEKYACPKCGGGMVDEAIESEEEIGEEIEIEEGADVQALLDKHGLKGVNQPKLTPKHPKKKGIVLAKEGDRVKLIRFGAQGYRHNYSPEGRKAFKTRHAANIAKGKMSAAYWADKVLWAGPKGHKKTKEDPAKKARHEAKAGELTDKERGKLAKKASGKAGFEVPTHYVKACSMDAFNKNVEYFYRVKSTEWERQAGKSLSKRAKLDRALGASYGALTTACGVEAEPGEMTPSEIVQKGGGKLGPRGPRPRAEDLDEAVSVPIRWDKDEDWSPTDHQIADFVDALLAKTNRPPDTLSDDLGTFAPAVVLGWRSGSDIASLSVAAKGGKVAAGGSDFHGSYKDPRHAAKAVNLLLRGNIGQLKHDAKLIRKDDAKPGVVLTSQHGHQYTITKVTAKTAKVQAPNGKTFTFKWDGHAYSSKEGRLHTDGIYDTHPW